MKTKVIEFVLVLRHEEVRFKALFCFAYGCHTCLEHVNPESAGAFYVVIELLHTLVG